MFASKLLAKQPKQYFTELRILEGGLLSATIRIYNRSA